MPRETDGRWKVPADILAMKPTGTLVKRGHDDQHYYVYEHHCVKGTDGKWHTRNGPLIGYIQPGIGYISKNGQIASDKLTILEYGQYALAYYNSMDVLNDLKLFFNSIDAVRIYVMSIIMAVQGKVALYKIPYYFKQSWFSVKYPTMKMGEDAIRTLLRNLGSKTERPDSYQDYMLENGSSQMIVDGHVIRSSSYENDLAAYGSKYKSLKDMQVNLLTILDGVTHRSLANRFYLGSTPDKVSIKGMIERRKLANKLFVVDKGFYSLVNLNLFSSGSNHYIVPLPMNTTAYRQATVDMTFVNRFVYQAGKTKTTVEYKEYFADDGITRVIVFRDVNLNAIECESYERKMQMGIEGFTHDQYQILKTFFGVIVLQTDDSRLSCQRVYEIYKSRWSVETYYDYIRNDADFNAIGLHDYYEMQGYAFLILITSQISYCISEACSRHSPGNIPGKCLLMAQSMKINYIHNLWKIDCGMTNKMKAFLEAFNVPINEIPVAD